MSTGIAGKEAEKGSRNGCEGRRRYSTREQPQRIAKHGRYAGQSKRTTATIVIAGPLEPLRVGRNGREGQATSRNIKPSNPHTDHTEQHCQRRAPWKAPGAHPPFVQGRRQGPLGHAEARLVSRFLPRGAFGRLPNRIYGLLDERKKGLIVRGVAVGSWG